MSDTDSFIEEVSEEVRRDRMFGLWKRYGPFVIGAIVLFVAGAAVMTWLDQRKAAQAQEAGAALIAASIGSATETAEAMEVVAGTAGEPGLRALAQMRAAGAFAVAGNKEAAIAAFQKISLGADTPDLLRDVAALRALMLSGEDMPPADFATALSPLAEGAGPYSLLALEARGVAKERAGDREGAIADLSAVHADAAAPAGLRRRVAEVLTALGAAPETAQ